MVLEPTTTGITILDKRLQEAGAPAPTIKAVHKIGYALCRAVVVD
jgi:hypothetical protein